MTNEQEPPDEGLQPADDGRGAGDADRPPAAARRSARVLALDVGGRRIGVAMSDEQGLLAAPLTTLKAEPQSRALAQIAALVREHGVGEVVVGLPLTLRGEVGPQAQVVQAFVAELERELGRGVRLFDERLTSVAAEQMLRDLGVKPEKRKERIDEVAASIILQDYLDHMRSRPD